MPIFLSVPLLFRQKSPLILLNGIPPPAARRLLADEDFLQERHALSDALILAHRVVFMLDAHSAIIARLRQGDDDLAPVALAGAVSGNAEREGRILLAKFPHGVEKAVFLMMRS